jgi:hypothetical protein
VDETGVVGVILVSATIRRPSPGSFDAPEEAVEDIAFVPYVVAPDKDA